MAIGFGLLLSSIIASGIASIASSAISSAGASKANADTMAFNSAEAQKNRDFQAQMSNTAHQREVADLKAAGLNPILSAGSSGASTPVGASSSAQLKNAAPDFSHLASVFSSVKDLAMIDALTNRYESSSNAALARSKLDMQRASYYRSKEKAYKSSNSASSVKRKRPRDKISDSDWLAFLRDNSDY